MEVLTKRSLSTGILHALSFSNEVILGVERSQQNTKLAQKLQKKIKFRQFQYPSFVFFFKKKLDISP